jgi:putative endonuclease
MSKWYLYMIKTQKGKLYTGIAVDVERRFLEHLSGFGGAKFFRSDPPEKLVYVEDCLDRSDASQREAFIKKLTRKQKELLIKGA